MSMGGGGGGGQPQPTSTTNVTKVEPFSQQIPYLQQTFEEAKKQFEAGGPQYYPGVTQAPRDPLQIAAQNNLLNYAGSTVTDFANKNLNANQFLLGPVLSPESNPNLAAYGQASVRPIYDALVQKALPAIRGNAVTNNSYGGSRQGIAEGLAVNSANQLASDQLSKIYSEAYGQGLDALTKGLLISPQTTQLGATPFGYQEAIGEGNRAESQSAIDQLIAKYNYEQTLPAAMLAQFSNLIQGNFGGTTTATGTALNQARSSSALGSIAGGGLLGLGLSSSIAPLLGTTAGAVAPWAAGAGALLGLFFGQ